MNKIKELLSEVEILISEYRDEVKDNTSLSNAHRNISEALTELGRD